jgi:hypothetical protein
VLARARDLARSIGNLGEEWRSGLALAALLDGVGRAAEAASERAGAGAVLKAVAADLPPESGSDSRPCCRCAGPAARSCEAVECGRGHGHSVPAGVMTLP